PLSQAGRCLRLVQLQWPGLRHVEYPVSDSLPWSVTAERRNTRRGSDRLQRSTGRSVQWLAERPAEPAQPGLVARAAADRHRCNPAQSVAVHTLAAGYRLQYR